MVTSPEISTLFFITVSLQMQKSLSQVSAPGDGAGASPTLTVSWEMVAPLTSTKSAPSLPISVCERRLTRPWNVDSAKAVTVSVEWSPRIVSERNAAAPRTSASCRFA